eukprot:SAG31_NODE_12393_length_945_cov_1.096927_2_plen_216_part_00
MDWLVNEHLTGNNSVGRADGLISGIFLDDDISATGGFAENCKLADCEHDMGLSSKDMVDLTNGWAQMMNRTQARVLELGGFDWRMFRPVRSWAKDSTKTFSASLLRAPQLYLFMFLRDASCSAVVVLSSTCKCFLGSRDLRRTAFSEGCQGRADLLCWFHAAAVNNTLQSSAMMFGLGEGCDLALDKNGDPVDLDFYLPAFLALRGPYAWLGWSG